MQIVRIDPMKPDRATLAKAAAVLKAGGLVVYPTETAYALGCDLRNAKAAAHLFSVKKRDARKPLPAIVATSAAAARAVKLDRYARALARAFWPGSLTLVLPLKSHRVRFFAGAKKTSKDGRVGEAAIRVSPHPWAAALSRALDGPIASTSANRSGKGTAYDAPSVLRDLGTLPDLVLDAGPLKRTPTSTIARVHGGAVEILREGQISGDDLRRALMAALGAPHLAKRNGDASRGEAKARPTSGRAVRLPRRNGSV